ncbi:MAG: DEAD/DEAH box helicase [Bacilli bacterium]
MTHVDHECLHPALRLWFQERFKQPTGVQSRAWETIGSGVHTLIASPTGSGKTLAALVPWLDRLLKRIADTAPVGVTVLYVTPLKALNNDVHVHIRNYIDEIAQTAVLRGIPHGPVRIGVRTGDTTAAQRSSMLRTPPQILITTPESLYVLLTSSRGSISLKTVETVIIDEIHDLAAKKRGAHLSLSLERLATLCDRPPQRIGLSATQKPMERIAQFLGGWEDGYNAAAMLQVPRSVTIIDHASDKRIQLQVRIPQYAQTGSTRQNSVENTVWTPLVTALMDLLSDSRTAVIYVNNRRLCERLTLRLNDHAGAMIARAHHGSVARETRLEVERLLQSGALRCLIATSSLDLGIDVGDIDMVIQIDSPKSATVGIQRFGRANHTVQGVSRGVILVKNRSELPEIAVLAERIRRRDSEAIEIPRERSDVLAQHIVSMAAVADWRFDDLYGVLTRSDCYRELSRERLATILEVLAGHFPFVRPLVDWDRNTGVIAKRANTQMAALLGAGAIPQSSAYPVHHADSKVHLGELDEEFVFESRVGDVFQLGTSSWMIQAIHHDRVYVTPNRNRYSEIPFWKGASQGRSHEIGSAVGALLDDLARRLQNAGANASVGDGASVGDAADADASVRADASADAAVKVDAGLATDGYTGAPNPESRSAELREWLHTSFCLDADASGALITSVAHQLAADAVPTQSRLVAECFTDDTNQTHLIIHSVFGRRFNRTLMMAWQQRFQERLPCRFYSYAKDNGIQFVFPEWDESWLRILWEIDADNLAELLDAALPGSPLFAVAFRHIAETALLLARGFTRTPIWLQRLRTEELLRHSLPFAPTFPFIRDAFNECLNDHLDVPRVRAALRRIHEGALALDVVKRSYPSSFARQFLSDFVEEKLYESDALAADLQLELLAANSDLSARIFGDDALSHAIDGAVLHQEQTRLDRNLANAPATPSEVYTLLKQRGDMADSELRARAGDTAPDLMQVLVREGRAVLTTIADEQRFICSDELYRYEQLAHEVESAPFVLTRFCDTRLSFTAADLVERYGLPTAQVQHLIDNWRQQGQIQAAPFLPGQTAFVSKSLMDRLVRKTMQKQRQQVQTRDPSTLWPILLQLHRLTPSARRDGVDGLRAVIAELQGLFLPVSHWETVVFPARLNNYRKDYLDLLCASGDVFWMGKGKRSESAASSDEKIAFFLTGDHELYTPRLSQIRALPTAHARLLEILERRGATFLATLSAELDDLPSRVLEQLYDLVWEGRVANDQFAPLRHYLNRNSKHARKLHSAVGRWYSLGSPTPAQPAPEESAVRWVDQLLRRHVVLSRHTADDQPFSWDTVQGVLHRMEEWGMVTRGLFVEGVQSLQYVAKETAAALRRSPDSGRDSGTVVLSAVDPANPYGAGLNWPQRNHVAFARKAGNYLVIRDGEWLLWIENRGRRLYWIGEHTAESSVAENGLGLLMGEVMRSLVRQHGLRKIVIDSWNGRPITESPAAQALEAAGAQRSRASLVLWPMILA